MTNQHPITPPPELVEKWRKEWRDGTFIGLESYIATQSARWGADQELEACVQWLANVGNEYWHVALRAARRPKPPSLKAQALLQTNAILNDPYLALLDEVRETLELNRRALEALDD